jgi:UDP-N-acetylglucosamine--N-acetylmuramyl-(pentapeptide) pyrophosphoryl-undecaprenol N-acetylglucosamine transferase
MALAPPSRRPEAALSSRLVVLAAGGTGGHLFPAQALAEALRARGWRIVLATDERVDALTKAFPAEEVLPLQSATFNRRRPWTAVGAGWKILQGIQAARAAFNRLDPEVVAGFGGYPSLPALFAALTQARPCLIHEQNAVLGRANRLLAPRVSRVARSFPTLGNAPAGVLEASVLTGNPVRPPIRALATRPYDPPGEEIRVLVTGGSQGARLLSEKVPQAFARLAAPLRARLRIVQQARPESLEAAKGVYAQAGIAAEVAPFFTDIAERLAAAHLVIGRSGASTVSELAVAGKPAILIPLGVALDDDQGQNARVLADAGAAQVIREGAFSVEDLANRLEPLLADPATLAVMAAAARSVAAPDAAERLADLVESLAEARRAV